MPTYNIFTGRRSVERLHGKILTVGMFDVPSVRAESALLAKHSRRWCRHPRRADRPIADRAGCRRSTRGRQAGHTRGENKRQGRSRPRRDVRVQRASMVTRASKTILKNDCFHKHSLHSFSKGTTFLLTLHANNDSS